MSEAEALISRLGLEPHPEGGWYAETWRGPPGPGDRPVATAIHFLLREGERSHWHRVDAAEVWLWHAGAALDLRVAADEEGPAVLHRLGPDLFSGDTPQVVVPARQWQAAASTGGWTLVSCVVAPGFHFDGFELAPEGFDIPGGPAAG